jgi:hypothetical protein
MSSYLETCICKEGRSPGLVKANGSVTFYRQRKADKLITISRTRKINLMIGWKRLVYIEQSILLIVYCMLHIYKM